jgi:hypothetical protein
VKLGKMVIQTGLKFCPRYGCGRPHGKGAMISMTIVIGMRILPL